MASLRFEVRSAWDGGPLAPNERARIDLRVDDALRIEIEATDYGDPPPPQPSGRCDRLWDFEVVELFLLGDDDRYLELEFGPHGHYLALSLAGRRRVVTNTLELAFEVERVGTHWRGFARAPLDWLPTGLRAANAYAIHGVGPARRHLAWQAVPGDRPDFHALEFFAPITLRGRAPRRA